MFILSSSLYILLLFTNYTHDLDVEVVLTRVRGRRSSRGWSIFLPFFCLGVSLSNCPLFHWETDIPTLPLHSTKPIVDYTSNLFSTITQAIREEHMGFRFNESLDFWPFFELKNESSRVGRRSFPPVPWNQTCVLRVPYVTEELGGGTIEDIKEESRSKTTPPTVPVPCWPFQLHLTTNVYSPFPSSW